MVKKNKKNSHKFKIIIRLIIILLLISNIFLFRAYNHANKETIITQEVLYKETKKDYNKENKYYANIKQHLLFVSLWIKNLKNCGKVTKYQQQLSWITQLPRIINLLK